MHDHPHDDAKVEDTNKVEDAVTGHTPGNVSANERIEGDDFGNSGEEGNAVYGRDASNLDAAEVNTPLDTGIDVKHNKPGHGLGGATNVLQSTPEVVHEDNRHNHESPFRAHPQSDADHGSYNTSNTVADGSSGVSNQNVNENLGYGDREEEHHHLGTTDGAAPAVSSISPTVAEKAFPHQSHDISHRDPQSAYGVASGTPENDASHDALPATGRADAEAVDVQESPSSVPAEGISIDHDMNHDSDYLPQSYDQRAAAHDAPDRTQPNSSISDAIKSSDPSSSFHSGDRLSDQQSAAPEVSSISPTAAEEPFPHRSRDISHRDPQSACGVASGTPESNASLDALPTGRADAEAIDIQESPSSDLDEGISTDHDMHHDSYEPYDQRAAAHDAPYRTERNSSISDEMKSSIFHSGDRLSDQHSAAPEVSSISPAAAEEPFPHRSRDISHRDPQSAYGVPSGTPERNASLDALRSGKADAEAIDVQESPSSVLDEGISTDHDMHHDSYESYDQNAAAHDAPYRTEPNSSISDERKSSDPASIFHSGDRLSDHQSASAHAPDGSFATREPAPDYGSSLQGMPHASYHDPMELVDHTHDKERAGIGHLQEKTPLTTANAPMALSFNATMANTNISGSGTAVLVDQISPHDQFLNDLTNRTERSSYSPQHERVNGMHHAVELLDNDPQQEKQIDQTDQLHQLNPSRTPPVSNYAQHHPSVNPMDHPNELSASPDAAVDSYSYEHSSMIPQDDGSQQPNPSYAAPVSNSAQQYHSMRPLDQSAQQLNSSDVAPVSKYAQQHASMEPLVQFQQMNPSQAAQESNYAQQHPSIKSLDQSQELNSSDATPANAAQQYSSVKPMDQSVQQLNSSHLAPISNYAQQHASIGPLDQSQKMTPSQAAPENNHERYPSTKLLDQSQQMNPIHHDGARVSNYDQQHPSMKSLNQSQELNPSDAAQRSNSTPHQHRHINEYDRPQELNSIPGQMNTSNSVASADFQTDLTPGRSGSTKSVTTAPEVNSHNTNTNTNTNINSSSTSKATGQHGLPLPVHPSQIGSVHTDMEGNAIEGSGDDHVKKGGFMSKMMNKLHLGNSTDHGSRT
ncbi:hypothetical protein O6H91_05G019200 [Diphasiastrum complanatum]|nr:hypothetical protein O6H91_05G019200 [Diphasiastrum complanatum]